MIKNTLFIIFALSFTILGISSCKDTSGPTQEEVDQILIEQYIADNNLATTKTASGLHYIIYDEGDSLNHPDIYSFIIANYKGELLDGTVFDDGSQELQAQLANLLPGWIEGVQHIGEGGRMLLIIPSNLAYGGVEKVGIPQYSCLVFNLELLQVYQ